MENSPVSDENVYEAIDQLYEALSKKQYETELSASYELSDDLIIEVTRFCITICKDFFQWNRRVTMMQHHICKS